MKQVTCFNLTETQLVKVSFRPAFWQSVVKQAFQSSIKKAVPRDGQNEIGEAHKYGSLKIKTTRNA